VREPVALDGVYAGCREEEVGPWLEAGFVVVRREDEYAVSTDVAPVDCPLPLLPVEEVDLDRLRLLDDELRQDVPGTDGWCWDRDAFEAETWSSPSVYLVAVDGDDYVGIVRIWLRETSARLGFVGVRRAYRGRGLGRALVARALREANALGHGEVTTEVDDTNAASQALFASFDARRAGRFVELVSRRP
jgi:ribosomal protein S18 acetylase RimI-like enzyme